MYNNSHRPFPHVSIPHDPYRPPSNLEFYSSYTPEPDNGHLHPQWDQTPTARHPSNRPGSAHYPRPRTRSAVESVPPDIGLPIPDPQVHRSISQRHPPHEYYHRSTKSDSNPSYIDQYADESDLTSPFAPSFNLPADEVRGFLCSSPATMNSLIMLVGGRQDQHVDAGVVQYDVCDSILSCGQ